MVKVNELLIEHVKELRKSLERWKVYEEISFEEFSSDIDKQNMIFHGMLRAIQAAIDIGNDIIAMKNLEEPTSYKEIFIILSNAKIIDKKLAKELSSLAGFRNVLVHLYYKIDLKRAYHILKTKRKVLERFLKSITKKIKLI